MNPALGLFHGPKDLKIPVREQYLVHTCSMGLGRRLYHERPFRLIGKWINLIGHPDHVICLQVNFLNRPHVGNL